MAFDMHIKFTGGKVKVEGVSQSSKHKGEIPVLAWSWGVANTGDLHTGGGAQSGGKVRVQDLTLTKYMDGSSHALLQACTTGARLDGAVLTVSSATGEQVDVLTLTLSEGVLITSLATGGSGGEDRLTENLTLHFGEFKYEFQPINDKGAKDGGVKAFKFNIAKAKV